ncbi:MBOAT family O-acyltransferase [Demequina sp.]|uniref:MBOAT family O-acyltransferase n=1 Tax=Demequina sp. TaxID=2050685 RepID=UPI003A8A675E
MVFTSTVFVFVFMPLAMAAFFAVPPRWRAWPLLLASAVFYAWGEPVLVLLILGTGVATYYFGKLLLRTPARHRRTVLVVAIVVTCIPLAVFKYAVFIATSLGFSSWAASVEFPLPIGVSFYTFMAIGYLVDIYRRRDDGAPRLLDFSGFLAMYPHLVAGPIVRWSHIGPQLAAPKFNPGMFGYGAFRVATGLVKKAVVADSIAPLADDLWASGEPSSVGSAWIAVLLYSAQIYLDFSAYSDIAIGLAAMMGIHFHENFRYPYVARSAREFWQRWHISLGSWFRDYVYIPMGGSRARPVVVWRNLLVVWGLTGLWHGAAWTFVLWGLYFGVLIGLERYVLGRYLERSPRVVQHGYGVLVAVCGWVLFRAVDVSQAASYYRTMFGLADVSWWDPTATLAVQRGWVLFAIAVALAAGVARPLMDRIRAQTMPPDTFDQGGEFDATGTPPVAITLRTSTFMVVTTVVCLFVATAFLVAVSYSPFIYFRF